MADPKPATDSPLATPQPWDLVAAAYAAEVVPLFEPFSRDALWLANLPPLPRIVDVATGPGTLALLAAADGAAVSAIDFSAEMVGRLRQRVAERRLAGIDVRIGDGQALPFDGGAFDAAFSMFGLLFFPDRAAGFRELLRVLKPQARAVVGSWAPYDGPLLALMESLSTVLPDLPFKNGGWPLSDPDAFAGEMTEAGFRDVAIHTITHRKHIPSTTEFWATIQRSMAPVVLLRHRMGEERWAGIAPRIFERLRAAIGDGPLDMPLTAYLAVGMR